MKLGGGGPWRSSYLAKRSRTSAGGSSSRSSMVMTFRTQILHHLHCRHSEESIPLRSWPRLRQIAYSDSFFILDMVSLFQRPGGPKAASNSQGMCDINVPPLRCVG